MHRRPPMLGRALNRDLGQGDLALLVASCAQPGVRAARTQSHARPALRLPARPCPAACAARRTRASSSLLR